MLSSKPSEFMCSRSGLGPRVHRLCRWCWRRSTELSDPLSYRTCSLPHPEWSTVIILRARNLATQQQVHSYHAQQRPARQRRGHDHARSRVAARHRVEFCPAALDLDSPAIPLEARWGAWKSRFSLHDGGTAEAAAFGKFAATGHLTATHNAMPSVCPGRRPGRRPGPQPVLGRLTAAHNAARLPWTPPWAATSHRTPRRSSFRQCTSARV